MRSIRVTRAAAGLLALSVAASVAAAAHAASAATYLVEDLGALRTTDETSALALDPTGVAVGQGYRSSQVAKALRFDGGPMTVPDTGDGATATGINRKGVIVGTMLKKGDAAANRAYSSANGTTQDLGSLAGAQGRSEADGVNAQGWVVGSASTWSGGTHAFVYRHGRMEDLGVLAFDTSAAKAVSDTGFIVGASSSASVDEHAFLYRNGTMTDLGVLGAPASGVSSIAYAVNDAGTVAGVSVLSAQPTELHAFRWTQAGGMQDLGVLPGGHYAAGQGIAKDGTIVGRSDTAGGRRHAFIVRAKGSGAGAMTDLNTEMDAASGAGWELVDAWAINDAGQIVGDGLHGGVQAAFRLTPIGPQAGAAKP